MNKRFEVKINYNQNGKAYRASYREVGRMEWHPVSVELSLRWLRTQMLGNKPAIFIEVE